MIGSGLKKLAQKCGMTVSGGVAFGGLMGYASTFSEGSGYKRIVISTKINSAEGRDQLLAAVNSVDVTRQFRVHSLQIRPRCIDIVFQDTVGTVKKIEEFIAWFYPLLAGVGATGANMCAECGAEVVGGGWYLVDDVVHHLHDTCAQRVQGQLAQEQQQRKESDAGSYVRGAVGALIGSLLGSVVWALVLAGGYVASIVGLLIGWLAEKGYTLLKGKQGKAKVAILIVAIILGVLVGTIAPDVVTLAGMISDGELPGVTYGDIPSLIVNIMAEDSEYMSGVISNTLMGLLFAGLGVFALLRKAGAEVADTKFKRLG